MVYAVVKKMGVRAYKTMIAFVLTLPTTVGFLSVLDYWYVSSVSRSIHAVIRGGCREQTKVLRMLAKAEGAHKHVKRSASILVVRQEWQWFARHHPALNGWATVKPFCTDLHRSCNTVMLMFDPCRRAHWGWWRVDPWWLTFSWCIINAALQHHDDINRVVGICLAQCPPSLLPPLYAERLQLYTEAASTHIGRCFATVCSLCQYLPILSPGHIHLACQIPDTHRSEDAWHKFVSNTVADLVCTRPDDDNLGMWDWVVRFADQETSLLSFFVKRYLQLQAAHRCSIALHHIYNTWYFQPMIANEIGKQGMDAKVARTLSHGRVVRKKVAYVLEEFMYSGRTVPEYCSTTMDNATGYFHLALFYSPRQMLINHGWSCPRAAQWLTRSHAGRAAVHTGLVDPYQGSKGPHDGKTVLYYPATTCRCKVTDMWHLCALERLLGANGDSWLGQRYQLRHGCRHPIHPTNESLWAKTADAR